MPHLSIDYSPSLEERADIPALCAALHKIMVSSDVFPTAGIRIRAHRADHVIVADGHADNDFLAMTLSVGAGRSTDQLKAAGDALFTAAQEGLKDPLATPHFALSLEIRVINPDLSWKDTPIHARLTGIS
ncbi:5-carboxymethyl-2-hydroxymuconate Delta-isomerase [Pseudosulfitobacter sp. DSM 107133]|uniref:5-carboxymethyl-2-hydroxymuconate Delta-isomerase n=1 Tax=Pseudosulfitobacter sp. DSM 107133 TaxID=2883100 RepID=UPI000DF340FE|nr:5-carboxymethyl-2-hydroxymuconate Delta-isomerase [Pseudosulfitobacter sp. DSM 107133]UOA28944.1 5-carboxymethyl-2-hydroxymuconate Delta-isomerase [Pseudosulfitobacter sp. DSM 107133]